MVGPPGHKLIRLGGLTLDFEPLTRMNLADEIVNQVRHQIGIGALEPGERIPSERAMAEQLGVSRTVVREAMQRLEAMGLVEIQAGKGVFVRSKTSDLPLFPWLASEKADVLLLLEVREALEARAAYLAAKNSDDEFIQAVKRNLSRTHTLTRRPDDPVILHQLDAEFHRLVSEASLNPFLADLSGRVNGLLNDLLAERRVKLLMQVPSRLRLHKDVADAIIAGKPEAAAAAMSAHVRDVIAAVSRVPRITPDSEDGQRDAERG